MFIPSFVNARGLRHKKNGASSGDEVPRRGQGTGTCPNLNNQRFAYLFPHSVLSWEGLYLRSGNGQFRSFMY